MTNMTQTGDGNYFSVKVRGHVKAFAEGNNRFWVLSDDGVRVGVNGTRYVNRWNDHAPTWDDQERCLA